MPPRLLTAPPVSAAEVFGAPPVPAVSADEVFGKAASPVTPPPVAADDIFGTPPPVPSGGRVSPLDTGLEPPSPPASRVKAVTYSPEQHVRAVAAGALSSLANTGDFLLNLTKVADQAKAMGLSPHVLRDLGNDLVEQVRDGVKSANPYMTDQEIHDMLGPALATGGVAAGALEVAVAQALVGAPVAAGALRLLPEAKTALGMVARQVGVQMGSQAPVGAIVGAISPAETLRERVKNAAESAGVFAGFGAIAGVGGGVQRVLNVQEAHLRTEAITSAISVHKRLIEEAGLAPVGSEEAEAAAARGVADALQKHPDVSRAKIEAVTKDANQRLVAMIQTKLDLHRFANRQLPESAMSPSTDPLPGFQPVYADPFLPKPALPAPAPIVPPAPGPTWAMGPPRPDLAQAALPAPATPSTIAPEAPAVPTGAVLPGVAVPVTPLKPLEQMNPEELQIELDRVKGNDKQVDQEIFGVEGAARYKALQKTANSLDNARADAASDEIAKMEDALTTEQQNRLFGIGEPAGRSAEDIRSVLDALGRLEFDSPQALGRSLRHAVIRLGGPSSTEPDEISSAQMRYAKEEAIRLGFDLSKVSRSALSSAAGEIGDAEDAKFMLGKFFGAPPLPEAIQPAISAPGPLEAFTPDPQDGLKNFLPEGKIEIAPEHLPEAKAKLQKREADLKQFGAPQEYREVRWDQIEMHPELYQYKQGINEAKVQNIVNNFDPYSLTPVILRQLDDGTLHALAGHHRREALFVRLGQPTVPSAIYRVDLETARKIARLSNALAEGYTPLEESNIFASESAGGMDLTTIGQQYGGKTPTYIQSRLDLQALSPFLKDLLQQEQLPVSHAQIMGKWFGAYHIPHAAQDVIFHKFIKLSDPTAFELDQTLGKVLPKMQEQLSMFGGDTDRVVGLFGKAMQGVMDLLKESRVATSRMRGMLQHIATQRKAGKPVPPEFLAAEAQLKEQLRLTEEQIKTLVASVGQVDLNKPGPVDITLRDADRRPLRQKMKGHQGYGLFGGVETVTSTPLPPLSTAAQPSLWESLAHPRYDVPLSALVAKPAAGPRGQKPVQLALTPPDPGSDAVQHPAPPVEIPSALAESRVMLSLKEIGTVLVEDVVLRGPNDVAAMLFAHTRTGQEHFYVVSLGETDDLLGVHFVSLGTLNEALVTPREALKGPLLLKAKSIILYHNHPSGEVTPSDGDVHLTTRIADVAKAQGITVRYHVIGDGKKFGVISGAGFATAETFPMTMPSGPTKSVPLLQVAQQRGDLAVVMLDHPLRVANLFKALTGTSGVKTLALFLDSRGQVNGAMPLTLDPGSVGVSESLRAAVARAAILHNANSVVLGTTGRSLSEHSFLTFQNDLSRTGVALDDVVAVHDDGTWTSYRDSGVLATNTGSVKDYRGSYTVHDAAPSPATETTLKARLARMAALHQLSESEMTALFRAMDIPVKGFPTPDVRAKIAQVTRLLADRKTSPENKALLQRQLDGLTRQPTTKELARVLTVLGDPTLVLTKIEKTTPLPQLVMERAKSLGVKQDALLTLRYVVQLQEQHVTTETLARARDLRARSDAEAARRKQFDLHGNLTSPKITPQTVGKMLKEHGITQNIKLLTLLESLPKTVTGQAIVPEIPNGRGVSIPMAVALAARNFLDLGVSDLALLDPLYAMEKVGGPEGDILLKEVHWPVMESQQRMRDEELAIVSQLHKLIPKIRAGSAESAAMFRYVEGNATAADWALLTDQHKQAVAFMKTTYKDLLRRWNETRRQAGREPVPERADYMTHFFTLSFWDQLFGTVEAVPDEVFLSNDYIHQNSPWNPSALARENRTGLRIVGEKLVNVDEDAVASFLRYVSTTMKSIYTTPQILKLKTYADLLPPRAGRYLQNWADRLSGKPATVDTYVPAWFLRGVEWLTSRSSANLLLGNLNFYLTNASNPVNTLAMLGPKWALAGQFAAVTPEGWRFAYANSLVLKSRIDAGYFESSALGRQVALGIANKADTVVYLADFAGRIIEENNVKGSFMGGYLRARAAGVSIPDAIQAGDKAAWQTQVFYGKQGAAPILTSRVFRFLTQFQTWPVGMMNALRRGIFKPTFTDEAARLSGEVAGSAVGEIPDIGFPLDAIAAGEPGKPNFSSSRFDAKNILHLFWAFITLSGLNVFYTHVLRRKQGPYSLTDFVPFSAIIFGGRTGVGGPVLTRTLGEMLQTGTALVAGDSAKMQQHAEKVLEEVGFHYLFPGGGEQVRRLAQGRILPKTAAESAGGGGVKAPGFLPIPPLRSPVAVGIGKGPLGR